MNTKKVGSDPTTKHCKDNAFSAFEQTIFGIFSTGNKFTAADLNRMTGGNDARKHISVLRSRGYVIKDKRLPGGRKEYWMPKRTAAVCEPMFDFMMEGGAR